mgnify:FL=1
MTRCSRLLALAALLLAGPALADLKPGRIPSHAWRLLAPDVSTQQDVLELFGAPRDKLDVKTAKFFRYLRAPALEAMSACVVAGSERLALWKYDNVNRENDGKFTFMQGHNEDAYTYIAFRADGRVCNVLARDEEF